MISENKDNSNDQGQVNEPDGVYQPTGPLNFEKVWLMFQETDKKFRETDRKFQDTDRKFQDTDRKFQDTERVMKEQSKEADRRFMETDRIVREVTREVGGIGNNLGEVAETYFFQALENIPEVSGIKIEQVGKLNKKTRELQRQYDVVLFGRDTLIVVEVKHKLETKDIVAYCEKSLPVLKQLFPEYARYKVIGAVAGMTATDVAVELAFNMGLLVFTQSDQEVQLLNPDDFQPKQY